MRLENAVVMQSFGGEFHSGNISLAIDEYGCEADLHGAAVLRIWKNGCTSGDPFSGEMVAIIPVQLIDAVVRGLRSVQSAGGKL